MTLADRNIRDAARRALLNAPEPTVAATNSRPTNVAAAAPNKV
jgi:hypothetical protein